MRKLSLLLLFAASAIGFTACNDFETDYPSNAAFATVRGFDNSFYFVLDDSKTVYPSDMSRVPGFVPTDGARTMVWFNLLPGQHPGFDYNAAIYSIDYVYWGNTKIVVTQEELDALADDKIDYNGSLLNTNYLNMGIRFNAADLSKQAFSLILNDVSEVPAQFVKEGYLNLELRRNANGDTAGLTRDPQFVSFPMVLFADEPAYKKGIILRINTSLHDIQYVQIELIK